MSDQPNVVPLRPPLITGNGPVLVVLDADAAGPAAALYPEYAVIVSPLGEADWSSAAERVVTIWPPAEDSGRRQAHEIGKRIVAARAAMVRIVDTAGLPDGWSLGDTPPPGVDLRELLLGAKGFADADEVARLAHLNALAYDREKKAAARRLGVGIGALDQAVAEERRAQEAAAEAAAGAAAAPAMLEPWPEPVEGARLLTELSAALRRYVACRPAEADAVALWVAAVHALPAWDIFPRLLATSAEPNCGKTTLCSLVAALVPRPDQRDEASVASIYRSLDRENPPTLILDEMDHLPKNDRLRRILNSGHRRGAVITIVERGAPVRYSTFAPVVLALIEDPQTQARVPATIASRSIRLCMKRRRADENIDPFDAGDAAVLDPLATLARKAARWAHDSIEALGASRPDLNAINRARDNWRPLVAVADAAGTGWGRRARRAAAQIEATGEDGGLYEELAEGIRAFFAASRQDRVSSAELAQALLATEGSRWEHVKLTKNRLAYLLRRVDVRSKAIRFGSSKVVQGYRREEFNDFLARHPAQSQKKK